MQDNIERREVIVRHADGLKMMSAGLLAKEAQKYQSRIHLAHNGAKADAKSVLDILTLAAGPGAKLFIEAEGRDAPNAVLHLSSLFDQVLGIAPVTRERHHDHLSQAYL